MTGSYDETARLWDLQSVPPTSQLLATHASSVSTVAISHDDRWVFTASSVKATSIRRSSRQRGSRQAAEPADGERGCLGAVFTDDGRWLITRSYNTHTLSLWTLDLQMLVKLACRTTGRDFTGAEWGQQFPRPAVQERVSVKSRLRRDEGGVNHPSAYKPRRPSL